MRTAATVILLCLSTAPCWADGPADNNADSVRQIPPPGLELEPSVRTELTTRLTHINGLIEQLRKSEDLEVRALLPDVEIFARAVSQAVTFGEFFSPRDIKSANDLLEEGERRARALLKGDADWTRQTGLVVRGFRSRLDGTVQPYGLEIPVQYDFNGERRYRCDLWFHGRGERSVELQFIAQRSNKPGQYSLDDGIVLHPFGRYSNAFKFAGEVDVFEALEHAYSQYRLDDDRIAVRGFSMGGAGCWHFAVHHPDRFFAANPGAGFSETPEFLKFFQGETLNPPAFEEQLWNLYDAPGWARNLNQLPTIAYSGELDRQKQAADVMVQACAAEGIDLVHIIGPKTEHKIHPEARERIAETMNDLARAGRRMPQRIEFATYTLKYNRSHWLTVDALQKHWQRATVSAKPVYSLDHGRELAAISLETENVRQLSINFPTGTSPFPPVAEVTIRIDEDSLPRFKPRSDGSFQATLYKWNESWRRDPPPHQPLLRKRHGLQGPIDDALMSSFLFVRPTGEFSHPAVKSFVASEMERAVTHWRQQMRGDARIKDDVKITADDLAQHNLILWGCPQSNQIIGQIAGDLPIQWNDAVHVGEQRYSSSEHVPLMIYPNPLNPEKYIVLNSSFTYREYDYLNNARQTPKLPDWVIIDIRQPPNSRWPGKIVAADFFDEQWQIKLPD